METKINNYLINQYGYLFCHSKEKLKAFSYYCRLIDSLESLLHRQGDVIKREEIKKEINEVYVQKSTLFSISEIKKKYIDKDLLKMFSDVGINTMPQIKKYLHDLKNKIFSVGSMNIVFSQAKFNLVLTDNNTNYIKNQLKKLKKILGYKNIRLIQDGTKKVYRKIVYTKTCSRWGDYSPEDRLYLVQNYKIKNVFNLKIVLEKYEYLASRATKKFKYLKNSKLWNEEKQAIILDGKEIDVEWN